MTAALMEYETIDADQIADIMAGRTVRPVKTYNTPGSGGNDSSTGSSVPVAEPATTAEVKPEVTAPAAASPKAAPDTL